MRFFYYTMHLVINMKVKIFDFEHELDLEEAINDFISNKKIIDIKFQISHFYDEREQLYSFSALIIYEC